MSFCPLLPHKLLLYRYTHILVWCQKETSSSAFNNNNIDFVRLVLRKEMESNSATVKFSCCWPKKHTTIITITTANCDTMSSHEAADNQPPSQQQREKEKKTSPELSSEAQRAIEALWGLKRATFHLIKHSENHTYLVKEEKEEGETPEAADIKKGGSEEEEEGEGEGGSSRYIIRLTPQDHRSRQAIQAELDYILLLHSSLPQTTNGDDEAPGVRLCRPIPLAASTTPHQNHHNNHSYIGTVAPYAADPEKKEWFVVLFEHAQGRGVIEEWIGLKDEGIIAAWGRSLGQMHHAIASQSSSSHGDGSWDQMAMGIPQWNQTHGGAADIETIQARAQAGHDTSKLLSTIWHEKLVPFLASCGAPHASVYGVIHGDLNPSNFWSEKVTHQQKQQQQEKLWVFDFDQVHHNWFGFELGVILQMVQFFEEMKWAEGFDGDKFTEIFLAAYREAYPPMAEAGHMEPDKLEGWQLYRDFFQAAVAVDILFQVQEKGKQFEDSIVSFCRILAERFTKKRHALS